MQITIENVSAILESIGCKSQHEARGAEWHRVFIHLPQPEGHPVSIGRVMFHDGLYQWAKWYSPPAQGDLTDSDIVYFSWYLMITLHKKMSVASWESLKESARKRAIEKFELRKESRSNLNKGRTQAGKKARTKAIAQPNQRGAAREIFQEYVSKEIGKEFQLFCF